MEPTSRAGTAPGRRGPGPALVAMTVLALVAVTVLALVVRVATIDWLPNSDWSVIELRTRDVGAHWPLLGPYSRFGWNHPGPLLFEVLALPYRLLGSRPSGLLVGALLVNLTAVAVAGVVCRRRGGGLLLAWGALLLAVLGHGLSAAELVDPWNPYVAILPLLAAVLAAWDATLVPGWTLAAAFALGSFAVQSHAGYGIVVVAVLLVPSVATAIRARHDPRSRRVLGATAAVFLVLWIPPAVDAIANEGGNARDMIEFFSDPGPTRGTARALELVSDQLTPAAPWVTGSRRIQPGTAEPAVHHLRWPVLGLGALAATGYSLGRRDRARSALGGLALLVTAAGVLSVSRIVGFAFHYLVEWLAVCGVLCALATGWTLLGALAPRHTALATRILGAAAAVMGVVVVAQIWTLRDFRADESRTLARLTPAVVAEARDRCEPVLVTADPDLVAGGAAAGLIGRLEHAGVDVRVASGQDDVFGRRRALGPRGAACQLLVVSDGIDRMRDDPGAEEIAVYDPLTPGQRARYRVLNAEYERAVADFLVSDDETARRRADALARRIEDRFPGWTQRVGVFRVPLDDARADG